jgi:NAD-dependent SIR2 family protein deacetylase
VPKCPKCSSYIKPDIVFFGERLPQPFFDCQKADFQGVDLLLVMGTSLSVKPVSTLVPRAPARSSKFLVNKELVAEDQFTKTTASANGTVVHGVYEGDCDEVVEKFVRMVGWQRELETLVENGRELMSQQ